MPDNQRKKVDKRSPQVRSIDEYKKKHGHAPLYTIASDPKTDYIEGYHPSDALFPKDSLVRAKQVEKIKKDQRDKSIAAGKWKVVGGDHLGKMAKKWGVSADKIASYNKVDPRKLNIGSTILKPK